MKRLTAWLVRGGLVAGVALGAVMTASGADKPSAASSKQGAPAAEKALDRVILKSGRVVEGHIIEESDAQVKMRVIVAGIEATTTYARGEILEIKRGSVKDVVAASKEATGKVPLKSEDAPAKDKNEASTASDPDQTRLYLVELKGRFGFDISKSSLSAVFEAADKEFNDLVDGTGHMAGRKVVNPATREKNVIVLKMKTESSQGFGSVFVSENIGPVVEEQVVERGRRVVFWIEEATGGSAFMPFISPEIYFTPDGRLGGIADLDTHKTGDHMVDEKLIGAFMGHAEGFTIKGGYGDHIPVLRAMLRKQYWLAVMFEGGKPVYLSREPKPEDGPGWTILSDDGEGDRKDPEDKLNGNDMFMLNPEWADKMGISKGTAETIDDLAFRLGVQRNYKVLEKHRGQKAIDEWKDGIEDAVKQVNFNATEERPLGKLWVKFREIQGQGDFSQRRKDRGQKLQLLREIRAIVSKYAEVLDPGGQGRGQIDAMIAEIQLEAERDARAQRGTGGGDGGGQSPLR